MDLGSRLLERTVTVGGEKMLHVVALISFKGKAEVQYMDPLGLSPGAGAGTAGVKVLGSVEIGFPLADLTRQIAKASRRSVGARGAGLHRLPPRDAPARALHHEAARRPLQGRARHRRGATCART